MLTARDPWTATRATPNGQAALNGLYATCTNVNLDADGSFYVDMQVAHPHGRDSDITFTVIPVGVDEGSHGGNNSPRSDASLVPFTGRLSLPAGPTGLLWEESGMKGT